jgi:hypothetical protein
VLPNPDTPPPQQEEEDILHYRTGLDFCAFISPSGRVATAKLADLAERDRQQEPAIVDFPCGPVLVPRVRAAVDSVGRYGSCINEAELDWFLPFSEEKRGR